MSPDAFKIIKLSQASSLAKVISNKTAQQIIEFIGSTKKATATQISKALNIPASTIHYNMKALVKGGIVDDSQFTYSTKGKTIIHYTLTNNILVIVPESQDHYSILNSIKALVPSFLGIGLLGVGWTLFSKSPVIESSVNVASRAAAMPMAADFAAEAVIEESAPALMAKTAMPVIESSSYSIPEFIWGIIIATAIIGLIFIVRNYIISRKK